ncbi:hypothetical protein CRE_16520 [Caenorhabditis remanei]|uniref:Uncharacterized protein n=1 Tax=Caenorhabditis remanei TaxID=31234 RepID=E3NNW8_CAERE|nr:hypothetical protein CRE_16520 [Caenorhabditis remanei]
MTKSQYFYILMCLLNLKRRTTRKKRRKNRLTEYRNRLTTQIGFSQPLGSLNPHHQFHIVGSPILDSSSVRDLGILFEPDLKFRAHIKKSVSLARLRSSQILKSFKSNNPAFYSFLFKTYVLPILEYASVIFCLAPPHLSLDFWNPLYEFTIGKLSNDVISLIRPIHIVLNSSQSTL